MKYFKRYLAIAPLSLAIWRSLEAEAIAKVDIQPPTLDIGCAFGEFAGVFFERYIEVGVDISNKDLMLAAQKKRYKDLILADARKLPFKTNTFNTVIGVSSLEHIAHVDKVITEAYRVLKPGGRFVITVPTNALNELILAPFAKSTITKAYHRVFKHEVIIPKEKWFLMIEQVGFKIEYHQGILSKRQFMVFQIALLTALPTQIFRTILQKRIPYSPAWRVNLLEKIFTPLLLETNDSDANIIIVARKPK